MSGSCWVQLNASKLMSHSMNFSLVSSFYLSEYYRLEELKPVYFCIFLLLYLTVIAENVMLIEVVYLEKALYEPMSVLLCNLAVNELVGSVNVIPALLTNILSHTHEISVSFCQAQVFVIHTYAVTEFTILAVMSYDRYLAICYPLTYHTIMPQRLVKLIVFMWLYPVLALGVVFIYTFQLPFCGRTIENLYCMNYLLVKLACIDTFIANVIGLLSVALYIVPQLIMIFYSYAHIFKICILSFSKTKSKALRTCTPHLLVAFNYSIGCFFEIARSRFDNRYMAYHAKLFVSLYFFIVSPLLNPVIYGLSMQIIRIRLFGLFRRKNTAGSVDAVRKGDSVN